MVAWFGAVTPQHGRACGWALVLGEMMIDLQLLGVPGGAALLPFIL